MRCGLGCGRVNTTRTNYCEACHKSGRKTYLRSLQWAKEINRPELYNYDPSNRVRMIYG